MEDGAKSQRQWDIFVYFCVLSIPNSHLDAIVIVTVMHTSNRKWHACQVVNLRLVGG